MYATNGLFGVGIVLIAITPITWFSYWWAPPFLRCVERIRYNVLDKSKVKQAVLESEALDDRDPSRQFVALLPHIQRTRELLDPYTGTYHQFIMAFQEPGRGRGTLAQITVELEYLAEHSTKLGISSPEIWPTDDDFSLKMVYLRLMSWNLHLATLEAKIHQNDLEGIRH